MVKMTIWIFLLDIILLDVKYINQSLCILSYYKDFLFLLLF